MPDAAGARDLAVPAGLAVPTEHAVPADAPVADDPAVVAAPRLRPAFDLHVDLAEPLRQSEGPEGTSWWIPIVGGRVTGRLTGEVLPGGGDRALERPDGVWVLDARYALRTSDGALVEVANVGYWAGTDAKVEHYQTAPRFRTGAPQHAWLTRTVFVGHAVELDPLHIRIEVHEVVDPRS